MVDHVGELCARLGFQLISHLGSGAFKNAYRVAKDAQELVLKIAKQPGATARDAREIESLRRCDHPGIARIIDSGSSTHEGVDYQYIVESFCGGESLGDILRGGGRLSISQIDRIAIRLIDCLGYLESLRLVHRDIKPDNLILNSSGDVTLIDFGLVRDLANVSLTHSWVNMGPGTPFYAAPEQLTNQKAMIGWRTDQFSLGVTLCELLLQFHPYQNINDLPRSPAIVERVALRQPHGDCLFAHPSAEPFFQQMTHQWPVKRFASNGALIGAWENFMNQYPNEFLPSARP